MAHTTIGTIDAVGSSLQSQQYRKKWETQMIGVWSLPHKASGAFVGECGLVARGDLNDLSLRYTLCHSWRDRGLARESVEAALSYATTTGGLQDSTDSMFIELAAYLTTKHRSPSGSLKYPHRNN